MIRQLDLIHSIGRVLALSTLCCAAFAQEPDWSAHNRYMQASFGSSLQDYRELDTQGLSNTAILDSESGEQSALAGNLRWQFANGVLAHVEVRRRTGPTSYQGYLQSGSGSLTPYAGKTGNEATDFFVRAGFALDLGRFNPSLEPFQLVPIAQYGRHQWQRNLVQYSETYSYDSYSAGALVQWQLRPGMVLEAQALLGRTQSASVSVSQLGFAAEQTGDSYKEFQLGLSQGLFELTGLQAYAGWRLAAQYNTSQSGHNASPVANGLQAPPNVHNPSMWMLGVQKQF